MPCSFQDSWLQKKEYKSWIRKDEKCTRKAFCLLCCKAIDVAAMGEGALLSHSKGAKHMQKARANQSVLPITQFAACAAACSPSASTKGSSQGSAGSSFSSAETSTTQTNRGSLAGSIITTDVLKAEILWVLKCVDSHYSMNSCAGMGELFRAMFPDSEIARSFACADKKAAYLCSFGLAPYFYERMTSKVKSASSYVLLFDETLNKDMQEKQMDVHVRFWDKDMVVTQFLDSMFFGHCTADDMFEKLSPLVKSLGHRRLLQLSMDGPHVNLKLQRMLMEEIEQCTPAKLLNIGTCGLHILHNAFRAGCAATSWELELLLCSVYNLFRDSPARREDFQEVAKTSVVPLKFCRHRWLENAAPAQRVTDLLPGLVAFCSAAKNRTINEPTCNSFKDLMRLLGDPLLKAKLQFFISVANEVEPFLKLYQTDRPMIPFVAQDLGALIKNLMKRIIKDEVIENKTAFSVCKIQIEENLKDPSKVDVGFSAKRSMLSLKASDKQRYTFRTECRDFIKCLLKKLLEKAPNKYPLVRCLTWLNPVMIASSSEKDRTRASKDLEQTLHLLCDAGRIREENCDSIKRQFSKFCEDTLVGNNEPFRTFDYKCDRVDELLYSHLSGKTELAGLLEIVQQVLLLSHSQATVERGFSIHKQTTVENLLKESLVAKRLVIEAVRKAGGPASVPITKELLCYASSARTKYGEYLEQQRKEEEEKRMMLKRKAADAELETLKKKRKQLQDDISSLLKSADSKAEGAEKFGKLSLISESNALRKRAKEKSTELEKVDKLLEEKAAKTSQQSGQT